MIDEIYLFLVMNRLLIVFINQVDQTLPYKRQFLLGFLSFCQTHSLSRFVQLLKAQIYAIFLYFSYLRIHWNNTLDQLL